MECRFLSPTFVVIVLHNPYKWPYVITNVVSVSGLKRTSRCTSSIHCAEDMRQSAVQNMKTAPAPFVRSEQTHRLHFSANTPTTVFFLCGPVRIISVTRDF